ncbi:MAG: hemerythrin domain-containing protein [Burkholderiaceae bacterium]
MNTPVIPIGKAGETILQSRPNLYAPIHKALRLMMCETLVEVGQLDLDDRQARDSTLAAVRALLDACRAHVGHENDHIHPAIEAVTVGGSQRVANDHVEHLDAIAMLSDELEALAETPDPLAAHAFYLHLSTFVAENFVHMRVEETAHNALLWRGYDDQGLHAIHDRLLASIPPQEMMASVHWMLRAASAAERSAMLLDMQQGMPREAFAQVLRMIRPHLETAESDRLAWTLALDALQRRQAA